MLGKMKAFLDIDTDGLEMDLLLTREAPLSPIISGQILLHLALPLIALTYQLRVVMLPARNSSPAEPLASEEGCQLLVGVNIVINGIS